MSEGGLIVWSNYKTIKEYDFLFVNIMRKIIKWPTG